MRRFDPGTRLATGGVTAPVGSYERHPQLRGQRAAAGTPQRHVTGYQQRPTGENGRNLTARIQHRLAHRQVRLPKAKSKISTAKIPTFCGFNWIRKVANVQLPARPLSDSNSFRRSFHYRTSSDFSLKGFVSRF